MYLRASEKASGVENFHSAVGSKLIRRELITKALHAGAFAPARPGAAHFKYAKTAGQAAGRGPARRRPARASLAGGRQSGFHHA